MLEIRRDRKVSPQVELMKICTTLISSSERTKATSSMEEHGEERRP